MLKDAVSFAEIARVLVVKLRHHGDVLLAAPVFSVLAAHAPRIQIDALVYDDTAPMLEQHPSIAELHVVGREWKELAALRRAAAEWRLYRALRARRYDLIVHLSEHPRGAWLVRTLRPRYSVAPAVPGRGAFWRASFTHLYPELRNGRRHRVELNLDALRRIGVQPREDERKVLFVPGAAAERRAAALLAEHGLRERGFVHVHPASRWQFKCWPAQRNAELLERLAAAGHRIVLTAAPDPAELALVEEIARCARCECIDLAGRLSIKELGALAARARIFIGVDSMPMHLAAALGTPVVALFGPSGELEWGPWRVPHRIVTSTLHACRPCGLDGCGGGKVSECLTTLPVAQVLEAVQQLLAEAR